MYDAQVSSGLISKVTEAVAWQNRPLDVVCLDCIMAKVRHDKRVINKAVYIALGINLDGEKEGAKFWLSVLTELKERGVQDMFIDCVDGLTEFPEAIKIARSSPVTKRP